MKKLLIALLSLSCILTAVPAQADDAQDAQIKKLIAQLGDADAKTRDAATGQLLMIGKPALPQLQEALNHKNPEVKSRAEKIIQAIEPPPPAPAAQPAAVGAIPLMPLAPLAGGAPRGLAGGIVGALQNVVNALNDRNAQIEQVLNQAAGIGGAQEAPLPAPPQATEVPTIDLLDGFGLKLGDTGDGLRVTDLKQNTPADKIGLAVGDIIVKCNGKELKKLDEARKIFTELDKSKPLRLEVTRRGEPLTLTLPPP